MTRIVITGACGKMGRVINDIVNTRDDCEITAGIDIAGEQYADFPVYKKLFDLPEKPDVIIDFSHPSLLDELLDYCKINNVPVVIATTGYTDEQIKQIKTAAGQIPVFFTFNEELGNKMHYVYDRHSVRKPREKTEIGMHSIRGGTIVGEHDVIFAGRDEVITLSHSAGSKQVFAVGSVNAAVFLSGCEKGLYQMSDLLSEA